MRMTTTLALAIAGSAFLGSGSSRAQDAEGPVSTTRGTILLPVGDKVHGYLRGGETHALRVHLAKGDVYSFSVNSRKRGDPLTMHLSLLDPSGREINGDARVLHAADGKKIGVGPFKAPATGTYVMELTAQGWYSGDYWGTSSVRGARTTRVRLPSDGSTIDVDVAAGSTLRVRGKGGAVTSVLVATPDVPPSEVAGSDPLANALLGGGLAVSETGAYRFGAPGVKGAPTIEVTKPRWTSRTVQVPTLPVDPTLAKQFEWIDGWKEQNAKGVDQAWAQRLAQEAAALPPLVAAPVAVDPSASAARTSATLFIGADVNAAGTIGDYVTDTPPGAMVPATPPVAEKPIEVPAAPPAAGPIAPPLVVDPALEEQRKAAADAAAARSLALAFEIERQRLQYGADGDVLRMRLLERAIELKSGLRDWTAAGEAHARSSDGVAVPSTLPSAMPLPVLTCPATIGTSAFGRTSGGGRFRQAPWTASRAAYPAELRGSILPPQTSTNVERSPRAADDPELSVRRTFRINSLATGVISTVTQYFVDGHPVDALLATGGESTTRWTVSGSGEFAGHAFTLDGSWTLAMHGSGDSAVKFPCTLSGSETLRTAETTESIEIEDMTLQVIENRWYRPAGTVVMKLSAPASGVRQSVLAIYRPASVEEIQRGLGGRLVPNWMLGRPGLFLQVDVIVNTVDGTTPEEGIETYESYDYYFHC